MRGSAASARASPTTLRCAWESSERHRAGQVFETEQGEGLLGLGGQRSTGRGDGQVLHHGEVVEELDALPRPGQAEPGAGVGRKGREVTAVELDPALAAHEPGDGVDERGLAGPVGSDQPDELALADLQVDVDEGADSAEAHRDPVRESTAPGDRPITPRPAGVVDELGTGRGGARLAASDFELALPLGVPGAGDAVGIDDQGEDQGPAGDEQGPRADLVLGEQPLVEDVGEQALGRDQPGEDRSRHHRDAAQVGERDQHRAR